MTKSLLTSEGRPASSRSSELFRQEFSVDSFLKPPTVFHTGLVDAPAATRRVAYRPRWLPTVSLGVVRVACCLDGGPCLLQVVEGRPDVECFKWLRMPAHKPAAVLEDRPDCGDRGLEGDPTASDRILRSSGMSASAAYRPGTPNQPRVNTSLKVSSRRIPSHISPPARTRRVSLVL
jgi:hypothetical protein